MWTTYFDLDGIRPMTFDVNADGSTRHIYAQLSNFNGFGVVDFDTRKEVRRIEYPELPPDERTPGHGGNTAHGIGVTPDNKYIVANSSPEQQRLCLHGAGPGAGRRRPRGPFAELGDDHAGQQVRLHLRLGEQQRRRGGESKRSSWLPTSRPAARCPSVTPR